MRFGNSIGNLLCVVTWSCACALGISGCLPKNDSQPVTMTTSSLPTGVVNQPYSASVSGSGGTPPYTWAVSPALPASLSLNGSTGAITGTPGAEGTSSHTFSMIDSASPPQAVQKPLTLTIKPIPVALSITTASSRMDLSARAITSRRISPSVRLEPSQVRQPTRELRILR
jgi:hypothetical protein